MEIYAYGAVVGALIAGVLILLPVFKTVVRVAPYAYPNARIRAMRAELVKHELMEELAARPYNDVVYALERKYPEMGKVGGADLSYAAMDTAIRSETVSTMLKLKRISPPQTKRFISVYLSRYDVQVIESILRSQAAKINVKYDILHATEVFSKEFITRKTITLDDLANELKGTVYEPVIARHLDAAKRGEFQAVEEELDHLYFRRLLHAAKSMEARQYAKKLIDIHNVSLALKGLAPSIPQGKIASEELEGKSVSQIVDALKRHGYDVDAEAPEELERQLQIHLKKWAKALMAKDPLSEATIIGFLILKTVTSRNIAILLKLKQHGMPAERILGVLAI